MPPQNPFWGAEYSLLELSKSTQKLLNRKNDRLERISVEKLMAYKTISRTTQNILSKDDDYKMGAFRLLSRAFTSTDQEVAEHLLETQFPGCQPISGPQS
jgi:hypothetical protein